jgi:hypothetical protein
MLCFGVLLKTCISVYSLRQRKYIQSLSPFKWLSLAGKESELLYFQAISISHIFFTLRQLAYVTTHMFSLCLSVLLKTFMSSYSQRQKKYNLIYLLLQVNASRWQRQNYLISSLALFSILYQLSSYSLCPCTCLSSLCLGAFRAFKDMYIKLVCSINIF